MACVAFDAVVPIMYFIRQISLCNVMLQSIYIDIRINTESKQYVGYKISNSIKIGLWAPDVVEPIPFRTSNL